MTADKGTAMQGTVAMVASLHTKREGVRVAVQHLLLLHARVVRVGALRLDSHPVQLRQGALSCLPRQLHAELERRAGRLRIVTYLADPAVATEVDARKARRKDTSFQNVRARTVGRGYLIESSWLIFKYSIALLAPSISFSLSS